jgi:hypothetical protein
MATVAGRKAQVLFGGYDVSGYLDSAELSVTIDTAETTTFSQSSNSKTYEPTLYGATLSTSGKWQPAQHTLVSAAIGTDASVVTYCPGGATTAGDRARIMAVTAESYGESSPVGDVVNFSWDLMAQTSVGYGVLLHPLAEDTNTTTGSTYDGTAATTSGWQAALHVTAVDAGSWVITIEHATASNFSDGALVTGGTFTAATTLTAQRLVSAAGATLNRYVRYVATRTGGAGGDGITFSLAIARSIR